MNTKLKELAEQAEQFKRDEVSYLERLHNRYCTGDMEEEIFREKFAELIVQECAIVADECAERGSWMAGYRMKQRFGVEE